MGRCIDHQKRRDLLRTHNRVHIQDPDMLRYQKYAYYCIAFDKHSCNRPISYQLDIPFFKDKNKFFQHRYNTCYWFQFGWLKIKWIYAVFPISITLISHRLKYHYLSYLLLGNLMFYPCLIINTCLLIILAIPVSIFTSARQATFSFLASSWNNLTIRCTAAFLLLDTACTIPIENISIRTVATFNTDRFGSNVGNIVTNSGTWVVTTWWALVPNCIACAFWKALTVL